MTGDLLKGERWGKRKLDFLRRLLPIRAVYHSSAIRVLGADYLLALNDK